MEELWKDIEGYPGYQVSNLGRVRSNNYGRINYVLKLRVDKDGYYRVMIKKDKKDKLFGVHRLVALTFISNPNNYPCVNHKDENKQNNCVDNLEWCTVQYNDTYGTARQRAAEKTRGQKRTQEARDKIRQKALGRTPSEETRRKMSESQKKRFNKLPA